MRRQFIKSGFTLIEVVIVTALMGFLTLVISITISNSYKSYQLGQKTIELNEKCNKAILDFEKYARGATEIIEADSDTFTFLTYLKGDQNPAPSKVSYYSDQGVIYRSFISPVNQGNTFVYPEENKQIETIVKNVQNNQIFEYFNDASAELNQPLQIDLVKMARITLSVDNDANNPPDGATESTAIQFRNLKTNL